MLFGKKLFDMIDFSLLQESIFHYEKLGYNRVEVPWLVPPCIDDITRPSNARPYEILNLKKRLVASGEQSFLYQYLMGYLPLGRYQAITPCFRDDKVDITHCHQFIKNELIITDSVCTSSLDEVINDALQFYKRYLPESRVVKTYDGYDIVCRDVEIGSYGMRSCSFLKWIYGTGCAEPRLSSLIKRVNKCL